MARSRIFRGIAVITSIASLSLGPTAVIASSEQSSSSSASAFSSRFLNSLEQANEAVDQKINAPQQLENDELIDARHQRRELSWWSIALQLGKFFWVLLLFFRGF